MNKVTLSAAALTAIVVPAQVQAADFTGDEKKAQIEELRIQLNAAANAIKAQAPDVQEEFLLELSKTTANMNVAYDNDEALSQIQIDTWKGLIEETKTLAIIAQEPYTAKKELDAAFSNLNTKYQAALVIAGDKASYPHVSESKVKALKALGVEAIGAKIAAYNLKEHTIVNEKGGVIIEINTVSTQIKNLTDNIQSEEDAVANNEDAHAAVVKAYNDAKADYDEQLQKAITSLPTEVYDDWQKAAVAELNAQYRILNDVKKEDEALFAKELAATKLADHLNTISVAQGEITNIVDKYVGKMEAVETAKTNADAAIKERQDALNAIKQQLGNRKLTECDADINAVQAKINALKAEVDKQYTEKDHPLPTYNYAGVITDIKNATNKIDDNANPPHSYSDIIDNYDAHKSMTGTIATAQNTLTDNETAAKTESTDKKYNAAQYFTGDLAAVQTNINDLTSAVDNAYKAKTAVAYQTNTFSGKLTVITNGNTKYAKNTKDALDAYNLAQKTAADSQTKLNALKKKVTDPAVTIDGTFDGKSYEATIANIEKEIKAIKDAIAAALNLKDAKHLTAIKAAAAKTVVEDIAALTLSYDTNKDAYDKVSAIKAAEAVLDASLNRINAVKADLDGVGKDDADFNVYGDFAQTIKDDKADAETGLDGIETERQTAADKFNAAGDDKKQQAAAEAIAVLAKVNEQLGQIEDKVSALKEKAEKAKVATAANKEVTTKAATVTKNVSDVLQYVMDNATGDALTHYQGETTDLLANIGVVKNDLGKAYKDLETDWTAKKKEFIDILNTINNNAKDLKAAVVPNENAHKDQVAAVTGEGLDNPENKSWLQKTWQNTYDKVSNTDLSDAAAGYLADLAKLQERINTLNATIANAFGAGESVAQKEAIETEIKAIEEAIVAVGNASSDNYDANVDATNEKQHSKFEAEYKIASDKFSEAVNVLNQFSNIKNDASTKALEDLIPTHDAIYAYADWLRQLKAEESKKYNEYVDDVTDGVNDIYSSVAYCDDAKKYTSDIDDLLKEYQDKVNKVAKAQYDSLIPQAESLVARYEGMISTFIYDGKANAFKDVKDVVKTAKNNGTIDADGTITDRLYAVHMDEWLITLNNVGSLLENDLRVASKAERAKRLKVTTDLYESEKTAIAGFGEIDNAQYLQDLEDLKINTIDLAELAGDSYYSVLNTVIVKCEAYAQYTTNKNQYHSDVYKQAYAASVASKLNVEAYNRMIESLDLLVSDANDAKASVELLVVGHQAGTTYAQLKAISDYLSTTRSDVESWKESGNCVANESGYNTTVPAAVESMIKNLKLLAVSDEVVVLNDKIDEVKEEYNQVAKNNLDDVKEYDAKIQKLYDDVADIEQRFNDMKGRALDAAFGGAVDELAEQEVAIAAVNKALNDMYDENKQNNAAVAAINTAIETAERAVARAEMWAGYNDATQAFAGAEVEALRGELELIKADYEAKNAAGQILFYKGNIIFDLDNVAKAAPNTNSDLKKLFDKHKLNDNVYNTLLGTLNNDIEALNTAYGKIKDFKHRRNIQGIDQIEWNKNQLEENMGYAKEDLETAHEAVNLTWSHILNSTIGDFWNDIDALERGAKKYEADGRIGDIKTDIDASLVEIGKRLYGGDRDTDLKNEYRRINILLTKAYNYNSDAAADDYISNDIDGRDVRENRGGIWYDIHVDYKTTAWETLEKRIAQLTTDAAKLANDVVELSYIKGDADNDKRVTVNDYQEVRNWILKATKFEDVSEAQRYAADCNGDKEFTVADMTGISNIIFHEKWDWSPETGNGAPAKTRAKVADEDVMTITAEGEETTIFGKTVRMAVNLTHSEAFTAGQMDIIMPQGMKLVGQSMSDRANGHEVFANDLGNGVSRIVASTIDNNEFNGRSGALIYLDVEVGSDYNGGQITVDNVIFSDAIANSYNLVQKAGIVTGIDGIEAATVKERIYSVGGQMMKAVKKGINIIVGEDGKAKKVVNKK